MTQRTPSEPCLLCQINSATKTNSHILSKFISTNFLGAKGTQRKGYELSSETALNKKPRVIQDSAKESYLFCDECEEYLSVIEGLASNTFNNWQHKVANGKFKQTTIKDFLDIVDCNNSDPSIIRLFVYSLFWRVSISSHGLFDDYKLATDFEEQIRQLLLNYKATTRNDFLQGLKLKAVVPVYPFSIITAMSFIDETANVLLAPYSFDPYSLLVDRFSFMLFRNIADIKQDLIRDFSNTKPSDCRMMVFREYLWHGLMVKEPIERLAKQAINKKR